jgi:hypothetical protein
MKRLFFCVVLASLAAAQQALNNDAILKLVKAGMGDDLIVNMINTQPGAYSVNADDLIVLKSGGASDKVISAMLLRKNGGAPTAASAGPATPTPAAGPVHEIGIYYKKGDAWLDMEPEVVNFKTGGVLKTIATEGIVKGDINGHLKGAHSSLQIATPVELIIYTPEGIAGTEYQVLRLREQGDSREFRTMTGGVFHASGGASRDAVEFEPKKIAPRTYSISLPALKTGEYGILPPASGDATGSSGRLGKIYTFRLLE